MSDSIIDALQLLKWVGASFGIGSLGYGAYQMVRRDQRTNAREDNITQYQTMLLADTERIRENARVQEEEHRRKEKMLSERLEEAQTERRKLEETVITLRARVAHLEQTVTGLTDRNTRLTTLLSAVEKAKANQRPATTGETKT